MIRILLILKSELTVVHKLKEALVYVHSTKSDQTTF